jgi:phospholipase/carboxylesterase
MTTFPHYLTSLEYLPLENIFIPAELPSNKLMIILHGRGGKPEDFAWMAETFNFDDMHYLLLTSPICYEDGYTWYKSIPDYKESIRAVSKVLSQTLDILFEKDFDVSKSFLLGFSQGALLTFEFGARYKKKLRGYIAISGHIADAELLLKEMNPQLKKANWLCTHGTLDDALDFKTAQHQINTLQIGGMHIDFKSYDKAHSIETEEMTMIHQWIKNHST